MTDIPANVAETSQAIRSLEIALGVTYPVSAAVAHDALRRWYRDSDLSRSSALLRIRQLYLGRHESLESLARAIAASKAGATSLEAWPWTSMDWEMAGLELVPDIEHGALMEIGDHQWFRRATV